MRTCRVVFAASVLSAAALAFTPRVGQCQGGFNDAPHTLRRPTDESGSTAPVRTLSLSVFGRWFFVPRMLPTRVRPIVNASYSRPVIGFARRVAAR